MKSRRLIAILLVLVMGISQFTVALADKKSDAENKKQEASRSRLSYSLRLTRWTRSL